MNRLYGIKIDKKRWKIITDYENYHKYKLVDKEKEDIYFFNDMIGLEQVNEDEFLIFSRCSRNQRRITRYKLENSKLIKLFTADFSHFHFITDDKILFVY